ncbi:MAG TPA: AI-2E family transporter, partial [Anaerolineales bacterium]|nr:AI-2E family transporter [Anaerolineales bacterium]
MKKQSNQQWSYPFRYTMGVILFVAVVAFLIYAREAVKMLIIAGFSAYLISPAVLFLTEKTKLTRMAAVNVVYFTAIIFFVIVPIGLTPVFFEEIQIVVKDLLDVTTELSKMLSKPIQFAGMEFHFEQLGDSIGHLQDNFLTPLPEEALELLEATTINVLWFLIILVSVY